MLQQTLQQLTMLRLSGMSVAFKQQLEFPNNFDISFSERFSLIVQNEILTRETNRVKRLIKEAKFRVNAQPQDIIYESSRHIDKSKIAEILTCNWLQKNRNIIITGATGTGKTYLACAIGYQACKHDYSVMYIKLSNLIKDIKLAKLDGSYKKLFNKLIKPALLIIDDWGLEKFDRSCDSEILDMFDERYYTKSNIFTAQLPTKHWHDLFDDPTIADATLDRILTSASLVHLQGDSMRKNHKD